MTVGKAHRGESKHQAKGREERGRARVEKGLGQEEEEEAGTVLKQQRKPLYHNLYNNPYAIHATNNGLITYESVINNNADRSVSVNQDKLSLIR